jgi:hypothetical protein
MTELSATLLDRLTGGSVAIPAQRTAEPVRIDHDPALLHPRHRSVSGLRALIDLAAATPFAVALVASGGVDREVALAVLVLWPVLLHVSNRHARHALDNRTSARIGPVLRAGFGLGVLCWLASPFLTARADPEVMVPAVLGLTAVSLVIALLPRSRARPRLVLAGHPRDVRAAMAELHGGGRHQVVGVCLTRRTSTPFGEVPAYLGVETAAAVADRHSADALVVLPGKTPPATLRRLEWAVAHTGTPSTSGRVCSMSTRVGPGSCAAAVSPWSTSGRRCSAARSAC